jgi:hypothetical protein
MEFKTMIILRKIATPFIIILLAGFVGVYNWNNFINDLHNKAIKEQKNNVWFAKKSIILYFHITFLTLINIISWLTILYFLFS